MKKTKKEGLALDQLKKIRKIASIIVVSEIILFVLIMVIGMIIMVIGDLNSQNLLLRICIIFFVSLVLLTCFIEVFLNEKIKNKKNEIEVAKIKNKAKEANLKNCISLKSEDIKNKILSNNIEKILLLRNEDSKLLVEIYLKSGFCLPAYIEITDMLSIMSNQTKETLLENTINSITIIDDEENSQVDVAVDTKGYMFHKKADDIELLYLVELKK